MKKNIVRAEDVQPSYEGWSKAELQNRIDIIKQRGSKRDQKDIPLIEAAMIQQQEITRKTRTTRKMNAVKQLREDNIVALSRAVQLAQEIAAWEPATLSSDNVRLRRRAIKALTMNGGSLRLVEEIAQWDCSLDDNDTRLAQRAMRIVNSR